MTSAEFIETINAYQARTRSLVAEIDGAGLLLAALTFADASIQASAAAEAWRAKLSIADDPLEHRLIELLAQLCEARFGAVLEAQLARVRRESGGANPETFAQARVELAALLPSSVRG